jgi:hypothetical protein
MRALALKGGATTKEPHGSDPRYYCSIGRLGAWLRGVRRLPLRTDDTDHQTSCAEPDRARYHPGAGQTDRY